MKLKYKQVGIYRNRLLLKQGRRCAICGDVIKEDPVLDHCHEEGYCRGVLHRECNALEGKILNWCKRFGRGEDKEVILKNILRYWKTHSSEEIQGNPLHPTHKSQNEKEISKLRKRLKQVKRQSTKDRIQKQIQELQEND